MSDVVGDNSSLIPNHPRFPEFIATTPIELDFVIYSDVDEVNDIDLVPRHCSRPASNLNFDESKKSTTTTSSDWFHSFTGSGKRKRWYRFTRRKARLNKESLNISLQLSIHGIMDKEYRFKNFCTTLKCFTEINPLNICQTMSVVLTASQDFSTLTLSQIHSSSSTLSFWRQAPSASCFYCMHLSSVLSCWRTSISCLKVHRDGHLNKMHLNLRRPLPQYTVTARNLAVTSNLGERLLLHHTDTAMATSIRKRTLSLHSLTALQTSPQTWCRTTKKAILLLIICSFRTFFPAWGQTSHPKCVISLGNLFPRHV